MPRTNSGLEIYKALNSVTKYIEAAGTHGSTTLSAPSAVGDATVTVAATTSFTAADPCFITGGAGTELVTIGTPNTTMPLAQPTLLVHPSGAQLIEAQAIALGHIDENALDFGGSVGAQLVRAATSRIPIATIAEPGEFSFSFNLLGWNNLNLQAAFGVPEGEDGTGTSSDPYGAGIHGSNIGTQSALQAFRFVGVNNNSQTIQLDLCGCTVEVSVQAKLGGTTPGVLTLAGSYTNLFQRIWA